VSYEYFKALEVVCAGDLLVEVVRNKVHEPLDMPGTYGIRFLAESRVFWSMR